MKSTGLQAALDAASTLARRSGLPLDPARRFFDERISPQLLRRLAPLLVPAIRRTGFKAEEYRRGYIRCRMPMRGNGNHAGIMYAGSLAILAEAPVPMLFAVAFLRQNLVPIAKELNIRYLQPARSDVVVAFDLGDRIEALEQEALAQGKVEFEVQGELKDAQGIVVAVSRGIYQLRAGGLR